MPPIFSGRRGRRLMPSRRGLVDNPMTVHARVPPVGGGLDDPRAGRLHTGVTHRPRTSVGSPRAHSASGSGAIAHALGLAMVPLDRTPESFLEGRLGDEAEGGGGP